MNGFDESLYRTIVESSKEGALLVDERGTIVWLNAAISDQFGYPIAELVGQRVEVLVPAAQRGLHELLREVYVSSPSRRLMSEATGLMGQRKDGSVFAIEVSLTPTVLDGRPMIIATVRDDGALEAAHEALRRVYQGYRMLPVGSLTWRAE